MLVDGDCNGFQLQGQTAFQQQMDATQAPLVRAGDAGELLVSVFGSAVERDLDGERPPFQQVISDPGGDKRTVGKQGDEEALLLGIGINVKEIFPGEDLSPGVENPQATCLRHLVQEVAMLVVAQLAASGL